MGAVGFLFFFCVVRVSEQRFRMANNTIVHYIAVPFWQSFIGFASKRKQSVLFVQPRSSVKGSKEEEKKGILLIILVNSFVKTEKFAQFCIKMSDNKSEIDSDVEQNYSLNANADPKNVQELTIYVSIWFVLRGNMSFFGQTLGMELEWIRGQIY